MKVLVVNRRTGTRNIRKISKVEDMKPYTIHYYKAFADLVFRKEYTSTYFIIQQII